MSDTHLSVIPGNKEKRPLYILSRKTGDKMLQYALRQRNGNTETLTHSGLNFNVGGPEFIYVINSKLKVSLYNSFQFKV